MKENSWSVGKIAERSGVSIATLHFYEKEGLITSSRNAGNQRRYDPAVLRRIGIIKTAQRLGIPLKEIAEELNRLPNGRNPTTADWKKLSTHWRKALQNRIEKLEELRDELDGCIGCGCLSLKKCKLRNPDDQAAYQGEGAVFLQSP